MVSWVPAAGSDHGLQCPFVRAVTANHDSEDVSSQHVDRRRLVLRLAWAGAAGGIAADAPATARWGYQLYGGHVLSGPMLKEMLDVSDGDTYGLGLMDFRGSRSNIDAVGHEGEAIGYRSILVAVEKDQLSIALLTPSTTPTLPLVQYLIKAGDLSRN